MFQRPVYQTAVALLTLMALVGAAFLVARPAAPPGILLTLPPTPTAPALAGSPAGPCLVNINTASAAELDTLPEIGPTRAASIISYREANGPFESIEHLLEVPGIGERILAALRGLITVGEDPCPSSGLP